MDVERLPGWLKAIAASLWVLFVLAPLFVWLLHRMGGAALWIVLPAPALVFGVLYWRLYDDDIPDAEYYRRKARSVRAAAK